MGYKTGQSGMSVLLGKESIPGTEAGTISTKLGLIQSIEGIELGFEPRKIWSLQNQYMAFAKSGAAKFGWQAKFVVQNFQFLYYIAGAESVSGTGPYTHTVSFANQLPSYSAELINDDLGYSRKFLGSKMGELTLNAVKGEEIVADATWKALSASKDTTPQSAAELSTEPWLFDHVNILTLNGVTKLDVAESLTWRINRNLVEKHTLGQNEPRFIAEGRREHELTLDIHSDDSEILDIVLNETEFQVQLKLEKDAANDYATITFPKCRVFQHDMQFPGEETVKESVPIVVIGDPTISIVDSIASYAS